MEPMAKSTWLQCLRAPPLKGFAIRPEHFKKAYIDPELRTVCCPNGADFAPEFLKSLVLYKQLV